MRGFTRWRSRSLACGPSARSTATRAVARRRTPPIPGRPSRPGRRAGRPEVDPSVRARRVTLAGHRGLYVEIASPRDISNCRKYEGLWRDPERGIYGDGQVDRAGSSMSTASASRRRVGQPTGDHYGARRSHLNGRLAQSRRGSPESRTPSGPTAQDRPLIGTSATTGMTRMFMRCHWLSASRRRLIAAVRRTSRKARIADDPRTLRRTPATGRGGSDQEVTKPLVARDGELARTWVSYGPAAVRSVGRGGQ